jgi:hypothetical protein
MRKREDIIEEIRNEVPLPKLDQETISELCLMVGVESAFNCDGILDNCGKVQRYMNFVESLRNVLSTFFENEMHERTESYLHTNRRVLEAENDNRLDRAIESAQFLAEFLRDLDYPDKVLELDYSESADEAAEIIEDAAAALKSYKMNVKRRRDFAPSRRGRKGNESLRALVLGLVCLYERYSGKRFTFFRHRERGEYVAVTDGHRFVLRAAQVWIGNVIDAKSLAIECERVNTHWKRMFCAPKNSSRKPRQNSRARSE